MCYEPLASREPAAAGNSPSARRRTFRHAAAPTLLTAERRASLHSSCMLESSLGAIGAAGSACAAALVRGSVVTPVVHCAHQSCALRHTGSSACELTYIPAACASRASASALRKRAPFRPLTLNLDHRPVPPALLHTLLLPAMSPFGRKCRPRGIRCGVVRTKRRLRDQGGASPQSHTHHDMPNERMSQKRPARTARILCSRGRPTCVLEASSACSQPTATHSHN
jgi:hypothetical protein